jgi:hypothetical protein
MTWEHRTFTYTQIRRVADCATLSDTKVVLQWDLAALMAPGRQRGLTVRME